MNRLSEALTALATCLCAQIETDGLDPVCFCGVLPGDVAVGDMAGECDGDGPCGMAWVRLVTAYPANGVGRMNETEGNCGLELGFDIEVGILRCFPSPDEDGTPPSGEQMLAAAVSQHADALTMQRALYCCTAVNNKQMIVGQYMPLGPQGGLYGGAWQAMVVV